MRLIPMALGSLCLGLPLPGLAVDQATAPALSTNSAVQNSADELTLAAAWTRTLAANPELQVAADEIEAATAARQQAALPGYNPELSWELESPRGNPRNQTWRLSQTLELGGQRGARIALAERGQEQASLNQEARRQDLQARLYTTFMTVLTAQEGERLAQASAALAGKAQSIAERRVAAGKVPPLEATRAGVARASAEVELAQARTRLDSARQGLSAFWGGTDQPVADGDWSAVPALPDKERLREALSQSAAQKLADADIAQREAELQLVERSALPNITLSGGLKRSSNSAESATLLGVSLPLPLFNRQQGKRREALVRIEQSQAARQATRINAQTALAVAMGRLQAAQAQLAAINTDILPGAEQALKTASQGYELGKFSFLDVLDAQRTLFQARNQYLAALDEAHRAYADIGRLVGFATLTPL